MFYSYVLHLCTKFQSPRSNNETFFSSGTAPLGDLANIWVFL